MIETLYYFLPLLVANSVPVLLRKVDVLNVPVSKKWFGAHKTYRGIVFGILAGILTYTIQYYLFKHDILSNISIINYEQTPIILGLLMPVGGLLGDLIESFVKRRLHIKPGHDWLPYDQYDFVVGSLVLTAPVYIVQGPVLFWSLTAIPLLSYACSKLAVKLHLK